MVETMTKGSSQITARQREVVALIAAGMSNDEVGACLGISPRTAKAHSDVLRRSSGWHAGDRFRSPTSRRRATTLSPPASARVCGRRRLTRRPRPPPPPRAPDFLAGEQCTTVRTGMAAEPRPATAPESPSRARTIKRVRLIDALDSSRARMRMLVAPAGYGKTVLAHEWSSIEGRVSVWCPVRSQHIDVAALAVELPAGPMRSHPGAGSGSASGWRRPTSPPSTHA